MKRILFIMMALCASCDQKKDEKTVPKRNCLDYATALLGMCFDAVGTQDVESHLQCDASLLELGYNACNMALEADLEVCIPYRYHGSQITHECSARVSPPAPPNWRGEQLRPAAAAEPEP